MWLAQKKGKQMCLRCKKACMKTENTVWWTHIYSTQNSLDTLNHYTVGCYDSCATFFPHSDESSLSFDFPYRDTRDTIVQAQYPLQKTYCVLTHTQRHAKAKIDVPGVEWWRELFCLEEGRSGHR